MCVCVNQENVILALLPITLLVSLFKAPLYSPVYFLVPCINLLNTKSASERIYVCLSYFTLYHYIVGSVLIHEFGETHWDRSTLCCVSLV